MFVYNQNYERLLKLLVQVNVIAKKRPEYWKHVSVFTVRLYTMSTSYFKQFPLESRTLITETRCLLHTRTSLPLLGILKDVLRTAGYQTKEQS